MPEISVIIPAYNAEKTLCETVNSALQQTFHDIEVIVVDDGSTDATLTQASSLHDPRLKVISIDNSGPSGARNRGIQAATGQYLSFLDADDVWKPEKLADQLHALKTSASAKVVYSWVSLIDETGKTLRRGSQATLVGNVYAHLLLFNFIENGSNILVERQALDAVGYFDPTLKGPEDRDLLLRLAARYDFTFVPKAHVLYRQSATSLSANIENQAKNSLRMIELAYQRAPQELQYLRSKSLFNIYLFLSAKGFQNPFNRKVFRQGLSFYAKAIQKRPVLLFKGVSAKVFLKALIVFLVFPKPFRLGLLSTLSKPLDTATLFGYVFRL